MNVSTERLFTEAHTQGGYFPDPVPESTLRALWDLAKWGPTSANCSPMRLIFVQSEEAKAKLIAAASAGNKEKIRQAPVTAIVGMDMAFYEQLPRLFPHTDARAWFAGQAVKIEETALRNGSLQGGYLILAARSLGLDCGPMSGFDAAALDAAFWAGSTVRSNFICTLGRGDPAKVRPRNPRLAFDEACRIA